MNEEKNISEEYFRLSKLYSCGIDSTRRIKKIIKKKRETNQELFQYKSSDWESIQNKLWNSYLFKDFGVQRLESYQQQTITILKLQSLLEYSLQLKFTQREIASLVSELRCTNIVLGEYFIQYPKLLTELKLLGINFLQFQELNI